MGGNEREGGICILICAPSQFPADTAESADPSVTSLTAVPMPRKLTNSCSVGYVDLVLTTV